MAKSMVEELPDEPFLQNKSINPEDYIMYHQGYFLELVHQLKDKLCQMTYAICLGDRSYTQNSIKDKVLSKLLKADTVSRISNLKEYLEEWDAYKGSREKVDPSPITVALKKRAFYHHYRNPLTADENYFQAKNLRFMQGPEFSAHFSDYGKQMIAEKGQQSIDAWQRETVRKMEETLGRARESVETISNALFSYYRLPSQNDAGRRIMYQYPFLMEQVRVKPCTRELADLDTMFQEYYELILRMMTETLPDYFVSLYALGSATRGEFKFQISDINAVIVIRDGDERLKEVVRTGIDRFPEEFGMPADTRVMMQSEFLSDENERLRFACKTDGFLVGGEDLLRNEKERNKSFELSWILNKDFKEAIREARIEVEENEETGAVAKYERIARDVAKRAFRLSFGQTIGNNAVYASSFSEMHRLMNFCSPENKKVNNKLYKLLTNRLQVDKEGVLALIEMCEREFFPLYDAIARVNGEES